MEYFQLDHYELVLPSRIAFGWGRRNEVGRLAATLGRRAAVFSGSSTLAREGVVAAVCQLLRESGVEPALVAEPLRREPEVEDVDRAVAQLRGSEGIELVVALGGGSAIDLAKAAAALATNLQGSSTTDFLEGVGQSLQIERPPLPMLAMPTTGGTGSEVTRNAVITSYDPPFKKSLRSPRMVPDIVLVDPQLSVTLPPAQTAHGGMDALTQCIESFISRRAQPVAQALALQGLATGWPALRQAVADGTNREARERMAHAALLSGLALANSGLGLAHGVAAALGAHCRVAHGLACAVMLPVALRANLDVAEARLSELARAVGCEGSSNRHSAERLLGRVEQLSNELRIPRRLRELGVRWDQLPAVAAGSRGNSMKGNPRELSDAELLATLEAAW